MNSSKESWQSVLMRRLRSKIPFISWKKKCFPVYYLSFFSKLLQIIANPCSARCWQRVRITDLSSKHHRTLRSPSSSPLAFACPGNNGVNNQFLWGCRGGFWSQVPRIGIEGERQEPMRKEGRVPGENVTLWS